MKKYMYKESRQYAKREVSHAKECQRREPAGDLDKKENHYQIYRIANHMTKEKPDISRSNSLKDLTGKLIISEERLPICASSIWQS